MFKILKKEYLANNIWLMDVEAPRVAKSCQPGQFVIVKTDSLLQYVIMIEKREPLL